MNTVNFCKKISGKNIYQDIFTCSLKNIAHIYVVFVSKVFATEDFFPLCSK